jgi:transcriptional regulator with XRE-family HTH domain
VDDLHQRLTKRIRELAKAAKVPVSHLPDRAGVSRSHFWEVMAGHKSPTLKWLGKIAASLEVDASVLLQLRDAPAPPAGVGTRRR